MKLTTTHLAIALGALCAVLISSGHGSAKDPMLRDAECSSPNRHAWLTSEHVPTESVLRIGEPAEREPPSPSGERKVRVGRIQEAAVTVEFSALRPQHLRATPQEVAQGAIRGTAGGGFVWSGAVESPGAVALRLRFAGFFLPRNAELYLYSDEGQVVGPYTGRGPRGDSAFWSHTLRGSKVTLQLRYEGADTERALRGTRFVVANIGHLEENFPVGLLGPTGEEAASNLCSFNADCIQDASSASVPPAIQPATDAVAMILFGSGPFLYVCSGGLLADTDANSDRPLFLTANHCVSRGREARSVEAYFQFTKAGSGCSLNGGVPRTLGSSILATGKSGDFTLLELAEPAPTGSAFLAWNHTPVAFADGTSLFRISHPQGAPQAYSEHVVDVGRTTCSSWPRGERIYSSDTSGGTEGGSSGSPVLNAAGQVVGQLSGACGFNVGDACDAGANATVDGAFAYYFSQVEPYLDPTTSCTDLDGDLWCVEGGDCDDTDATIHPEAPEDCTDAVDNDCDGWIDDADPDCQTGSCDLLPVGASCDTAAECCSGKCKGKLGARLCR